MSSDQFQRAIDPFFEGATDAQYITDADGRRRLVETRIIQQPSTITYSGVPGGYANAGVKVLNPGNVVSTSAGNFGAGTYGNVVTTTNVVQQPGYVTYTTAQPQVSNATFHNAIQGQSQVFVEKTVNNQPGQIVITETRTMEQPVQVIQTIRTEGYEARAPLINNGYNFYDGDVEDVHTDQPVSSDPGWCGIISGLLALLAALALVGLMGAIWARTGSSCFSAVPLSHLIMACIAVVAAVFCIWVLFNSRSDIANHVDVNHTLISIALLLALIFFAYFLASAVYMYMYRPFQYSDLAGQKCGTNPQWNNTFSKDWTFEEGWGLHRRMLFWVALIGLVAAAGFLILAIALWMITKFTVRMARIILGAACLAGVLLGLFGIHYLLQARNLFNNNYAMRNFKFSYLITLVVLFAIGVLILLLNAIWNIFKKLSGHFIFGTLLIIFLFVFVCFLGLMLRAFRETQFSTLQNQSNGTCRDIVSNFNSACFASHCAGGKYLPTGTSCSKDFLAANWEGTGELRYINPCCCNSFTSSLLCPLYYAAIMGLLFLTAIVIAIAANYYLSDTSEYLEFADKEFSIWEILFAVGIILAIAGFAFWWGFKGSDSFCGQNPADPTIVRDQFGNIQSYKDPNFVPVDLNKVYKGAVPPSAYIQGAMRYTDPTAPVTLAQQSFDMRTANPLLTLNGNSAACGTSTCGWRVGVLATNAKIANNIDGAVQGSSNARSLFFSDNNSNSDFVLLKGSQADVQNAINALRLNAIDISQPSKVYFNAQQVDLLNLNANGLFAGEALPSNLALDPNGRVHSPAFGWNVQDSGSSAACHASNNCLSSQVCGTGAGGIVNCNQGYVFHSSNGAINVNVPLQVQDVNGNWVNFSGHGLTSNGYFVHQNTQYGLNSASVSNGNLAFSIPQPLTGNINAVLSLNDQNSQYLPYTRYAIIPADAPSPYTLEPIKLLTKSGKGCVGAADVNACFANQKVGLADVAITLKDSESGKHPSNIPVKLFSGIDGVKSLNTQNTNDKGVATFKNVAYDYYTVQFDGDANYLPSRAVLAVQNAASSAYTLHLHPKTSGNTVLQQFISNKNADQDFNLNIVSRDNKSCNVSPYNKYCGYATHVNDVEDNQQGYENIRVNSFTESNYLAYLQNNPPSAATCGAFDISNNGYFPNGAVTSPRSLKFEWNNVRKAQAAATTYQTLYCFNGWGLNTIRHWQTSGINAVDASVCNQFWPANSQWSLDKLHELNSK